MSVGEYIHIGCVCGCVCVCVWIDVSTKSICLDIHRKTLCTHVPITIGARHPPRQPYIYIMYIIILTMPNLNGGSILCASKASQSMFLKNPCFYRGERRGGEMERGKEREEGRRERQGEGGRETIEKGRGEGKERERGFQCL